MGRRRLKKNRGLPMGLRCRDGYYSLRNPLTGEEPGLGRDFGTAIDEARNAAKLWVTKATGAPLLSREEILSLAAPQSEMCGIYVLIHQGRIMYVGQSANVHYRLAQHRHQKRIPFDSYHIIPCPERMLDVTEAAYIAALEPERNTLLQLKSLYETEAADTV